MVGADAAQENLAGRRPDSRAGVRRQAHFIKNACRRDAAGQPEADLRARMTKVASPINWTFRVDFHDLLRIDPTPVAAVRTSIGQRPCDEGVVNDPLGVQVGRLMDNRPAGEGDPDPTVVVDAGVGEDGQQRPRRLPAAPARST